MTSFLDKLATFANLGESKPAPAAPAPTQQQATPPTPASTAANLSQLGSVLAAGGDSVLALNMARERGNRVAMDNQILQDAKTMLPMELAAKYGNDAANKVAELDTAAMELGRFTSDTRDTGQHIDDLATNIGIGLGSVANIGALGVGLVSPEAGQAIAGGIETATDWAETLQTPQQNRIRMAMGIRAELDSADNDITHKEEVQSHGKMVADLRSLGRGVLDGASRVVEAPGTLETVTGEGIGSLFTGGLVGKGLKAGAGAAGLSLGSEAATMAGIGLTEAGGSYSDNVNQVRDMKHEDLMQSSPAYAEMIGQGATEEQAKVAIAQDAGLMAAAIQGVAATATGKLVSRFEGAPLAAGRGLREAGGNLGREGVEEAIQGGTGQFASNVGMTAADQNQSLLEGVGDAIGEGAVAGVATAGAVQGPALASGSAKAAVQAAVKPLLDRGAALESEAASNIENQLTTDTQEVDANGPAVVQAISAATPVAVAALDQQIEATAEPEAKEELIQTKATVESLFPKITSFNEMQDNPLQNAGADLVELLEVVNDGQLPQTRVGLYTSLGKLVLAPSTPEDVRAGAAMLLKADTASANEMFVDNLPTFASLIGEDHEVSGMLMKQAATMKRVLNHPKVKAAIDSLDSITDQIGEGGPSQQQVQNTLIAAEKAPERINPVVARQLLQNKGVSASLAPETKAALQAAIELESIQEAYKQDMIDMRSDLDFAQSDKAPTKASDVVARQIESVGGTRGKLSLAQHANGIARAAASGDVKQARSALQDLKLFAEHMNNKVKAIQDSLSNGGSKETYPSLFNGKWKTSKEAIQIHPNNQNSLAFGRRVAAEARAANELVQRMTGSYPQFGVQPNEIIELSNEFYGGKPKAVVPKAADKPVAKVADKTVEKPAEKPVEPKPQPAAGTRQSALKKLVQFEKKGKTTKDRFSDEELAVLKDMGATVGRKYITASERMVDYAAEQFPAQAALNEEYAPKAKVKAETKPEVQSEPVIEAKPEAKDEPEAEAKAETKEAPAVPVKAVEPEAKASAASTVIAAFPTLVKNTTRLGNSVSWFHKAFSFNPRAKTKLRDIDLPLDAVIEGIQDDKAIPTPAKNALISMLESSEAVTAGLNRKFLTSTQAIMGMLGDTEATNAKGSSREATRFKNGYHLSMLEEIPGKPGKFHIQPKIRQSIELALTDWRMNALNTIVKDEDEEIAKSYGISKDFLEANPEMAEMLGTGMSLDMAKKTLADLFADYLDIRGNNDVSSSYVDGILQGMAAEVLLEMEQNEMLIIDPVEVDERAIENSETGEKSKDGTYRTIYRVNLGSLQNAELRKEIGLFRKVIPELVFHEARNIGYTIGEPNLTAPDTQHNNPLVRNSKMQKDAIIASNEAAYLVHSNMANFYIGLGREGYRNFFGGTSLLDDPTTAAGVNKGHMRTLRGQNLTLEQGYDAAMTLLDDMTQYGKLNNQPLSEVKAFFSHTYNRALRMQQQGAYTAQNSKIIREIFKPQKTTLDLLNNETHQRDFWKSMSQGLGGKTARKFAADTEREARDLLEGPLKKNIDWLVKWIDTANQKGKPSPVPEAFMDSVKAVLKNDMSNHAMSSLMTYAEYKIAERDGKLGAFEHHNYMEADGVTNGPQNALMKFMSADAIKPEWVAAVKRGGAFFTNAAKTLNQHYADKNNVDNYQAVTNLTTELEARSFKTELKGDTQEMRNHLFNLMAAIGVDFKFDDQGNLVINRGAGKNPMTITVYGSGQSAMAAKVADILLGQLYAHISDAAANGRSIGQGIKKPNPKMDPENLVEDETTAETFTSAEFLEMVNALLNNESVVSVNKKTKKTEVASLPLVRADQFFLEDSNAIDFVSKGASYQALVSNVNAYFVRHLTQAIDEQVMQHVRPATAQIQKASQIQSLFAEALFKSAYLKRLAQYRENRMIGSEHATNDLLSRDEVNEIYAQIDRFIPKYTDHNQSMYLGSAAFTSVGEMQAKDPNTGKSITIALPKSMYATIDSTLGTNPRVIRPGPAGVKAIPGATIGGGDGAMVMGFMSKLKGTAAPLVHVFDGVNLKAGDLSEYSQMLNTEVFNTWQQNPVRQFQMGFDRFLEADPLAAMESALSDMPDIEHQLRMDLASVLLNKKTSGTALDDAGIQRLFTLVQAELKKHSNSIDINMETYNRVTMSVDQMAGAEAPYVHAGARVIPEGATDAQVADILNEVRAEVAAEFAERDSQPVPERITLLDSLHDYTLEDATGVRIGRLGEGYFFDGFIQKLGDSPIASLVRDSMKQLEGQKWKVVFGTREDLQDYEQQTTGQLDENMDWSGKTDLTNRVIYIAETSYETLGHELIHAATADKITAFYGNQKGSLSASEIEALTRAEGLMFEWLDVNADIVSAEQRDANNDLMGVINHYLSEEDMAGALSEFFAWSLSNQHLAEMQKAVKVKNPVFKIIGDALKALKVLLWGDKKAPSIDDSVFLQLRFNFKVITRQPSLPEHALQEMAKGVYYQSTTFGNDARLTRVRESIDRQLKETINRGRGFAPLNTGNDYSIYLVRGRRLADQMIADGFSMNMQEKNTFMSLVAAMQADIKMNANSLSRLEEVYEHVVNNLTIDSFLTNPQTTDPNEIARADAMLNAVTGRGFVSQDHKDRSSVLPVFLALSVVHPEMRAALKSIKTPRPEKAASPTKGGTMDNYLDSLGAQMMDGLKRSASGEKNTRDMESMIDALAANLLDNATEQNSVIEMEAQRLGDAADNLLKRGMEKASAKGKELAANLQKSKSPKIAKLGDVVEFGANLLNEKDFNNTVLSGVRAANMMEGKVALREFIGDVAGRTEDNKLIFDMISKTRAKVDQLRQRYRKEIPAQLRQKFQGEVTKEMTAAATKVLAQSDFGALFEIHKMAKAKDLILNQKARDQEQLALETEIHKLDPRHASDLLGKADQLAEFMVNGIPGANLQSNATAIAMRAGMPSAVALPNVDPALVEALEQYVSLLALSKIDPAQMQLIQDMITNEADGFEALVAVTSEIRRTEMKKLDVTPLGRINHVKGHIRLLNQEGAHMTVADKIQGSQLEMLGYKKVADYKGNPYDVGAKDLSYYFAPVSGRAKYNQGVMQTTHQTVFGVDPITGFSSGSLVAGRIGEARAVRRMQAVLARRPHKGEQLKPIYNEAGQVTAYERMTDPTVMAKVKQNTNLLELLGAWRGRQQEELLASEMNSKLIENLKAIYDDPTNRSTRTTAFVDLSNVSKKDDPVLAEAWRLIPDGTKKEIESVFGDIGFPIRKDMLNDVVGYRSASIGDFWTGETRWDPQVQKAMRQLVMGMFGADAYTKALNAESFLQDTVTEAKLTIVIKSVIVPTVNVLSNIRQLMMLGVGYRKIFRGMRDKTAELNDYINRRNRAVQLEAELMVAKGKQDSLAERRIEAQLQTIRDSYKSMSIYPLIENGEYTSISEGMPTTEEVELANGRWTNMVQGLGKHIPPSMKTPLRYLTLTKDTAPFRAMAAATQYGDFLAKAIAYDHFIEQGLSQEEALANINEEFVNYVRNSGRSRTALEANGLLWFYHFKIRSMKVAARTLHRNPARALLYSVLSPSLPLVGSLGSTITDNMLGVLLEGNLGHSMGPEMGLNAYTLNPWYNLFIE